MREQRNNFTVEWFASFESSPSTPWWKKSSQYLERENKSLIIEALSKLKALYSNYLPVYQGCHAKNKNFPKNTPVQAGSF